MQNIKLYNPKAKATLDRLEKIPQAEFLNFLKTKHNILSFPLPQMDFPRSSMVEGKKLEDEYLKSLFEENADEIRSILNYYQIGLMKLMMQPPKPVTLVPVIEAQIATSMVQAQPQKKDNQSLSSKLKKGIIESIENVVNWFKENFKNAKKPNNLANVNVGPATAPTARGPSPGPSITNTPEPKKEERLTLTVTKEEITAFCECPYRM